MFALPTEAGGLGERLLHDGRGVDEHLDVLPRPAREFSRDRFQFAFDDVVVVRALGVDGDGRI